MTLPGISIMAMVEPNEFDWYWDCSWGQAGLWGAIGTNRQSSPILRPFAQYALSTPEYPSVQLKKYTMYFKGLHILRDTHRAPKNGRSGFSSRQQGFETPRGRHFFPQQIQPLTQPFQIFSRLAKTKNRVLRQFFASLVFPRHKKRSLMAPLFTRSLLARISAFVPSRSTTYYFLCEHEL